MLQVAIAESNDVFSDYKHMYGVLAIDYMNYYSEDLSVQQISQDMLKGDSPELLNWYLIKNYIENKLDSTAAKNEADLMRYFPDHKFLYYFLQGADYKIISKLRYLILERTKTNFKFYVSYDIFNNIIVKENDFGFGWKVLKNDFALDNITKSEFLDGTYFEESFSNKFRIRFISKPSIDLKEKIIVNKPLTIKDKTAFSRIIFHIHGGGFISMSSSSHQIYLRKFAKECDACVFSIDYPLAPLSKYKNTTSIIFKSYIYVIVTLLVSLGEYSRYIRL